MYRCDNCRWETSVMTVRCKGIGCGRTGTMRAVEGSATTQSAAPSPNANTASVPKANVPIMPKVVTAPAMKPAATTPKVPATSVNIRGANPPAQLTPPTRVVRTGPVPTGPAIAAASSSNVVSLRAVPGKESAAVLQVFGKSGLWLRSVQFKNCQCLTEPDIKFDANTRSVKGLFADSWTYAHPSIAQYLFQLHPTEGKRAVALIVDWTQTADRYVEYALKDMSSNKKFGDKDVAKSPDQTVLDMQLMRGALAGLTSIEHNEVRTCQIQKQALVGLIWSPILKPTALSDGKETWEESKPAFQSFLRTLQAAGVAPSGLPIFTYEVAGGMTLTFLDFVA